MTNATKAEILEMGKKQCLEIYQKLTEQQQQQFPNFPQELQEAKTLTEAHVLVKPVYLLLKVV